MKTIKLIAATLLLVGATWSTNAQTNHSAPPLTVEMDIAAAREILDSAKAVALQLDKVAQIQASRNTNAPSISAAVTDFESGFAKLGFNVDLKSIGGLLIALHLLARALHNYKVAGGGVLATVIRHAAAAGKEEKETKQP